VNGFELAIVHVKEKKNKKIQLKNFFLSKGLNSIFDLQWRVLTDFPSFIHHLIHFFTLLGIRRASSKIPKKKGT